MVLLLNYTHPLTTDQLSVINEIIGVMPVVRALPSHVDRARPLADIACDLADAAGLSPDEWQNTPLILNPPALAPVAVALIAEIHGRVGYFPAILNVRPVAGSTPPRFEVAEVVNVQALRDEARARR